MTPLAASAAGPPAYLTDVVALVCAAALIGYLCVRVRVVPIVGFLLAGVVIGPSVLGVVDEREVVDAAAEVGVILLLFTIGIEFSIARLLAIRRTVLLGGSLQVGLTVAVVTGVCALFDVDLRSALFTGLVVSLSSTALVLKLLADRGATSTRWGQTALGLLVFQDLAVVAMVLLVPVLGTSGDGGAGQLVRALAVAAAVVVLTLVVARRLMPRVLEAVARACSPEVFLLSVIALCLGTAYLTALAGVSVSLGAFLAGLVVSESRHSAHALGEVLPLQILFSAVFFLSVGTLLDVGFLVQEPLLVLAAVVLVVVVKTATTTLAARVVGLPAATALSVGLLLAQVGEFAFVLERAGAAEGLSIAGLGDRGGQAFLAATVLLLVATPALASLGRRIDHRPRPSAAAPVPGPAPAAAAAPVLVSGWGAAARDLAADLAASGTPVALVTLSPDGAAEAERAGLHVVRGDSTKTSVLIEAGVREARVVVIADDEPEHAQRIASIVAGTAPQAQVVVLAQEHDDVPALHAAGAASVVLSRRAAHDLLVRASVRGSTTLSLLPAPSSTPPLSWRSARTPTRPAPTQPSAAPSCPTHPAAPTACARAWTTGCTCGCARRAATSPAATPPRAGTPRPTPGTTTTP
jgi:CPA2 family monovalent cation:H+ antiporter-2